MKKSRIEREINWRNINFFWSDERCAAPDSDESNFRMAKENLLKPLGISEGNIHRFKSELEPETAAADYERFLRLFFNAPYESYPHFDLILLGMGADGHTASLFPGTNILAENGKTGRRAVRRKTQNKSFDADAGGFKSRRRMLFFRLPER